MTEYHRWGGSANRRFLTVLQPESESRVPTWPGCGELSSWFAVTFGLCPHCRRASKLSGISLLRRTLIPLWALHPHDLTKAPLPIMSRWGIRASTYGFCGASIQSIAVGKCVRLQDKTKQKPKAHTFLTTPPITGWKFLSLPLIPGWPCRLLCPLKG